MLCQCVCCVQCERNLQVLVFLAGYVMNNLLAVGVFDWVIASFLYGCLNRRRPTAQ